MGDAVDTSYTEDPICPYCNTNITDAWEISFEKSDSRILDCDECGSAFRVKQHMEITYTTTAFTREEVNGAAKVAEDWAASSRRIVKAFREETLNEERRFVCHFQETAALHAKLAIQLRRDFVRMAARLNLPDL